MKKVEINLANKTGIQNLETIKYTNEAGGEARVRPTAGSAPRDRLNREERQGRRRAADIISDAKDPIFVFRSSTVAGEEEDAGRRRRRRRRRIYKEWQLGTF